MEPQASFKDALYSSFLGRTKAAKMQLVPPERDISVARRTSGAVALIPETSGLAVLFLKVGGEVRGSKLGLSLELATAN